MAAKESDCRQVPELDAPSRDVVEHSSWTPWQNRRSAAESAADVVDVQDFASEEHVGATRT